jgi:nicotinamide-nucleotide amidase
MSGGLVLLMVGDELLDGRSQDTNSTWIIQRASAEGWRVDAVEVVPDEVEVIARALERHARTAAAIIVSGGLGPTDDDLSREALARALGVELQLDAQVLAHIESLFARRGRVMPPSNRRQAFRTPGARVLANPVGSAVGLQDACGQAVVVLLPGVPAELRAIFEESVLGHLAPLLAGSALPTRRLRTTQVAESTLVSLVEAALPDRQEFDLAYCVGRWGVDLLLRNQDRQRLDERTAALREALGDRVYAEGGVDLPSVVVGRYATDKRTIAVAESCTGGLVGAALTSVPGSSVAFRGGIVAYADEVKVAELGVDSVTIERNGAVSEEVALAMAQGARVRLGADWGVSTTGIAGPGGGTEEKPVGTVCLGLSGPEVEAAGTIRLGGDRELVRRWSVAAALDALRRRRIARR